MLLFKKLINKFFPIVLLLFATETFSQVGNSDIDSSVNKFHEYENTLLDSALFYIKKAQLTKNKEKKIEYLLKEANALSSKGKPHEAMKVFKSALDLSKKYKLKKWEALCLKDMGYHCSMRSNYLKSYQYYLKSNEIFSELKDWRNYYKNINNIGWFLEMEAKYEEAMKNYNDALNYFTKINDYQNIISVKVNIGNLINTTEGPKKSIDFYNEMLKHKISDLENLSLIYYNIALNHFDLQNFNASLSNIDKAIFYSEKDVNKMRLIDLYAWKGEILSHLHDFKNANIFLKKSLYIAKIFDDKDFQISVYELLIRNHIKTKHTDSLEVWFEQVQELKDSLDAEKLSITRDHFILENEIQQTEKKTNQKQKMIEGKLLEKKIMLFLLIIGALLFGLLLLSYIYYRKNTLKNIELEKLHKMQIEKQKDFEKLEKEKIQQELNAHKREMLSSLVFMDKVRKEVEKVVKKIDLLQKNSIEGAKDLEKLKIDILKRTKDVAVKNQFHEKLSKTEDTFFKDLLKLYPNLSKNELKILSYIRIGLSTKEIADFQNVTIEAVRKSRYRARKKLNLDSDESLEQFLINF